jgi:hypothetical protein
MSWLLEQLPALEEWVKQVRSFATDVLDHGGTIPGFKVVDKRAVRKWISEGAVKEWADLVGVSDDELYDTKLRTMPQLEKKLGKKTKIPEELFEKKSSGVTLAVESDKRPAVTRGEEFIALPE